MIFPAVSTALCAFDAYQFTRTNEQEKASRLIPWNDDGSAVICFHSSRVQGPGNRTLWIETASPHSNPFHSTKSVSFFWLAALSSIIKSIFHPK